MIAQSLAAACGGLVFPPSAAPTEMTTLVVHCSDGRFASACDRFALRRLEVNRYDRLVVPGGAAWLADAECPGHETPAARAALEMLVEIHSLRQVILIAHSGCGYYLSKLGLPPERCLSRQRADLLRAGRWLRGHLPRLNVAAFYAQRERRHVKIQRVFGLLAEGL
jgi:hypothetical protein